MIHLPARPASQTHKFLKRRTNLVLHVSIWIQKITIIAIIAYVFSSLARASDRIPQYRTGYFADFHICINGLIFPIKPKKLAILVIKQLPYNPKTKNVEVIGYFEKAFLVKQQRKHVTSLVTIFLTFWPFTEEPGCHEIAWSQSYRQTHSVQEMS